MPQLFRVKDELQIETNTVAGETRGAITFVLSDNRQFGQIRSFGQYPFGMFAIDTSGMSDGVKFRTNATQGPPQFFPDGKNNPYSMTLGTTSCQHQNQFDVYRPAIIKSSSGADIDNNSDTAIFAGERQAKSSFSSNLYSSILQMRQTNFKAGETVFMDVGGNNYKSWRSTIGFKTLGTDSTIGADARGSLGFHQKDFSNSYTEAMTWNTTGTVAIPARLDAGTINATTYENLPGPTPSQLLPLTLDTTNSRVGVNKVTPTVELDVTGSGKFTGDVEVVDTITAGTVYATTYQNLPVSDLTPLTLDSTNDRVGINNVAPVVALDVTGSGTFTGTLTAQTVNATTYLNLPQSDLAPLTLNSITQRVGINNTSPTTALDVTGDISVSGSINGTLATANQPNITGLGTLAYLTVSGGINIDSSTLRVDSFSNRVGINKAAPVQALDVVGNIAAQGQISATSTVNTNLYFSSTNSNGIKLALRGTGNTNISTSTNAVNFCGPSPTSYVYYAGGSTNDGTEIFRINSNGAIQISTTETWPITQTIPGGSSYPLINKDGLGDSVKASQLTSVGTLTSLSLGGTLVLPNNCTINTGTGSPESTQTASVGSLFLRSDGTTGSTLYTKTTGTGNTGWTAVPGPVSLLPITLNTANNRVGINTTSPQATLEVVGDIWCGPIQCAATITTSSLLTYGNVTVGNNLIVDKAILGGDTNPNLFSKTGSPEGVTTANVGALYLRQDGTTGTTLYTKQSGTGNTGWKALGDPSWSRQLQSTNAYSLTSTLSSVIPDITLDPNTLYGFSLYFKVAPYTNIELNLMVEIGVDDYWNYYKVPYQRSAAAGVYPFSNQTFNGTIATSTSALTFVVKMAEYSNNSWFIQYGYGVRIWRIGQSNVTSFVL